MQALASESVSRMALIELGNQRTRTRVYANNDDGPNLGNFCQSGTAGAAGMKLLEWPPVGVCISTCSLQRA